MSEIDQIVDSVAEIMMTPVREGGDITIGMLAIGVIVILGIAMHFGDN